MKNIKSGDILITTNGNFQIISVECCPLNSEEFFGWCAMFIDDEGEYPLEIQYMTSDSLNKLIEWIRRDGEILDIEGY